MIISNSTLVLWTAFAIWYVLLARRFVPVKLMRVWFLLVNLFTILPVSAVTKVIAQLGRLGVPTHHVQRLCIIPLVLAFRTVSWLNPQIRMRLRFHCDEKCRQLSWRDIPLHNCAYVGNHTSFWDVYAFIVLTPLRHILNTRTLMKSSLRKIPIFGGIFDRVGHFPVYFKSDSACSFEVDKERQAQVQQAIDAHLRLGGSLAVFPEGAINKHPQVLLTFRYGTFATIIKHRMEVYYMVHVGGEKTWPWWTMLGGMPADLHIRVGHFLIDYDRDSSKDVAWRMQQHMQRVYNEVLNEAEGEDAVTAEAKARVSLVPAPTKEKQS
ncbi:acyltransferase-like protein, copy 1 [Leishmania guyanensis]|uniref:Putative acyltransferase-like protein, copy 1 n=1 Tax=Leishmania guyanensis TaxID=5670 RepID=A0A1E1INZ1_LEIGU|nr:Putative acyltransferase-like protein, copy 1 [Leishmania guyanensis]